MIEAAAIAILTCGDVGWTAALAAVWNSDDTGQTEAIRGAFIDLLLAGEDVETSLVDHTANPRGDAAARGAHEMLITLRLRPPTDFGSTSPPAQV